MFSCGTPSVCVAFRFGAVKRSLRLLFGIALLLIAARGRADAPGTPGEPPAPPIPGHGRADAPRVLPPGCLPNDRRLEPLLNLNGYFPFVPYHSQQAWQERAKQLRRQLLVATGLWPMPSKTPPNAVVHGAVERDVYTVAKVFLQSFPGHFVTGNLYRPKGRQGRLPAVLCPHGHWPDGRFYDAGDKQVRHDIAAGAERFPIGGRYPLQARCVQLARMGCIVFHYDMEGYADSIQLPHRAGVRAKMNAREDWGYFSPQAELRLQTMMGLQTYNSICALDWLSSLPEVDPQRIAVTGASGGGTQTFILCAIDPRPAVAFPAVMVSTAMQGGCTCENASYLRIGTGNVEIAALIAPRPLGMTAADDWTKEIATKGLPELKQHYKMLGAEDLVMAKPLLQFPHNYNYASRAVMYQWLNKHLKLGLPEPIVEQDYQPLSRGEMSVWDDAHPKPPQGDAHERSLLKWITADSQRQISDLVPKDAAGLVRFREVIGGAIDSIIGRRVPSAGAVKAVDVGMSARLDNSEFRGLLINYGAAREELPALLFRPDVWNKQVVVWVAAEGKQSIFDARGQVRDAIDRILNTKTALLAVDLFGQGEFTADGKPMARNRLNASDLHDGAEYAAYTYGYNHPLFVQRVHDILTAVAFARQRLGAERVHVLGLRGAGHWVAAARAQAGALIDRAAIDTAGFRFANLASIADADFLPGGVKYLDLPGMLALSAPYPLWLTGEGDNAPPVTTAAYRAAGAADRLTLFAGRPQDSTTAAVGWLLQPNARP
ncbi:MAG: acetylxylan esterase [Thermoguttaceae bacterium]|jgi:dienelactone hydrolase